MDLDGSSQNDHLSIGREGEEIACQFLKGKGYKILERNVRTRFGELGIVARAPDKTTVFVEVKTLRSGGALAPEDNMTSAKTRKTRRIAEWHANMNKIDDWRIDLVAVTIEGSTVNHYENI